MCLIVSNGFYVHSLFTGSVAAVLASVDKTGILCKSLLINKIQNNTPISESREIDSRSSITNATECRNSTSGHVSMFSCRCSIGFSDELTATITSLEQRGTVRCRSSFARKLRPLSREDKFQSWDARRLVRRSAVYPRNRPAFQRPSLESSGFRK